MNSIPLGYDDLLIRPLIGTWPPFVQTAAPP
jgi:hypothetical protein